MPTDDDLCRWEHWCMEGEMHESKTGDWVTYEDHVSALKQAMAPLQADLAATVKQRDHSEGKRVQALRSVENLTGQKMNLTAELADVKQEVHSAIRRIGAKDLELGRLRKALQPILDAAKACKFKNWHWSEDEDHGPCLVTEWPSDDPADGPVEDGTYTRIVLANRGGKGLNKHESLIQFLVAVQPEMIEDALQGE